MASGAIGSANYTAAQLANVIPQAWGGDVINDFYRNNIVAASHFWDVSELVSEGGDTINIPNLTEMSAHDKSNNSKVTVNSSTYDQNQLSIDTWKEVSFLIEKKEAKQILNSYSLQEKLTSNAAYTVGKTLDTALLSLYSGLSQEEGASDSPLTETVIRNSIKTIRSNDVPKEECSFFFNSDQIWGDVMSIEKFINADYVSGRPVETGKAGVLFGVSVYETNNLPTTSSGGVDTAHGLLAHKDAFVFATQAMDLDANFLPEYLGTLVTADALFGVAENRPKAAVHIKSKI